MGRATYVPINSKVLEWAISESGLSFDDIAKRTRIDGSDLEKYVTGEEKPNLANFSKLRRLLRRPSAVFLLSEIPESGLPDMEFRCPPGTSRNRLNYRERLSIRIANSQREFFSWISSDMGLPKPELEKLNADSDPEKTAKKIRLRLGFSVEEQLNCETPDALFKLLRSRLENLGVYVFLLPVGKNSVRGFSIWDDYAPVIVVNTTGDDPGAGISALLHQLGYLLARFNCACLCSPETCRRSDCNPEEKWADIFSASFLLPEGSLIDFLEEEQVAGFAARLYGEINSGMRPRGYGGGSRNRLQRQKDMYGEKAFSTVIEAVNNDIVDKARALSRLDIGMEDFDRLAAAGRRR